MSDTDKSEKSVEEQLKEMQEELTQLKSAEAARAEGDDEPFGLARLMQARRLEGLPDHLDPDKGGQ